jgi:ubiquinone/menaquinone biosynthesis C-methylase UbiE
MNTMSSPAAPELDPPVVAWSELALPDGWPDRLDLRKPWHLWAVLRKALFRKLRQVQLPDGLPLNAPVPKYALQEFHNLPNGNYSKKFTSGYSTGFDVVMLGEMRRARGAMARTLAASGSVLDVGCGAGHSSQTLAASGIAEVWGLDASPYLLQHAARRYPGVRFVQGIAERTGFGEGRFDAVSACYLFHEIPPRFGDEALAEFRRVLRPGGRLAILEPAGEQFFGRPLELWRRHGWKGIYFWWLARFVHEPYVLAWHRRDVGAWLAAKGFRLLSDEPLFPSRLIVAERV